MVHYYRSAIVGIFTVLGAILIAFLLAISKKGSNIINQAVNTVNPPSIPSQPTTPPVIPPTTNDLPPVTAVSLALTSGNYELTSPSRNIIVQASPLNGVVMVFINPVTGSAGRLVGIVNSRPPPANGTISIMGRNGVQIQGAPIVLNPGESVSLVALRDNVYIVRPRN